MLSLFLLLAVPPALFAATLEVGENKPFARPEAALTQAKDGDEIVVYPLATGRPYTKVALQIHKPRLTIRSASDQPVKFDGAGFDYSGAGRIPRAIVQFDPEASGGTLKGFDLFNAHSDSHNGAGVRINQANDVTIRGCAIHDNDMGIMSNGEVAEDTGARQLIEGCTITKNGCDKDPGYNHNLYLGGTSVTVRGCGISFSTTGHNLKSRAHFNWIECNSIHDSANRELDLVDEAGNTDVPNSDAVLLGNIITKRLPEMEGNHTVIHFGKDGKATHTGTIYLVYNTITTGAYLSPIVDLSAATGAALYNNLISDKPTPRCLLVDTHGNSRIKLSGDGNQIPTAMIAKSQIGHGQPVPWDAITLPWPTDSRPQLMQYEDVGQLRPRQTTIAGAK